MKISLAKRLSSQFHDRLGGVWDANKRGSITYELRREVLRVRNRTVHAGQDQVSYVAKLAVDRLSDFEGCICGLVAARSTSFPRTSWLLHEAGLLAGSAPQHLTDLRQSEDPLDWSGITQRLGELAMRRAYDDGAVAGEDPDALSIVIVVGPDDEPRLWVHDDHASSAAPLDRSPPSSLMTQLGAAGPPPAPMTIPTTLDQPDASILEWQNDYDVLPGYEVRLPDKAE